MGKASRFFKSLLGFKTTDSSPPSPSSEPKNQLKRRRWSFGKSRRRSSCSEHVNRRNKSIDETSLYRNHRNSYTNEDVNKQAIALADATAAAVEAAVAAAKAAAEVVRMTGINIGYCGREEFAAVKIQSCFRAYLARRALRALKALVKLQAVVRGHIVRKQTTDMMRRLQALIRAQTRVRAMRSQTNGSTTKPSSHDHHHGTSISEKIEHFPLTKHYHCSISKRNDSKSYVRGKHSKERLFLDGSIDHENDKIVEVDSGDKISYWHSHSLIISRGSTLQPTSSSHCASCEVNSFYDSRSCISGYSDHQNYMANTESSRAKVRSVSAPRLRPQLEASSATRRHSGCYGHATGSNS